MKFLSDAIADFGGLLEVNRKIRKPQMTKKASPTPSANCAVLPLDRWILERNGWGMKFRKTLGVLLTLPGCIAAFLGLAAAVLPLMANAQLQLVLDSFAAPSRSFLVNGINRLMTFVLNRPLPVVLGGVLTAAVGIALLACTGPKPRRSVDNEPSRPAPRFSEEVEKQAGLWRPSRAENALPDNPFAAPSMEDGLAAGQGGWRGGSFREIREERANTFAPAAQSHAAAFSSVKAAERSPYQRPLSEERSPYQRPEETAVQAVPPLEPAEPKPAAPSSPQPEDEALHAPSLSSIFEEDLLFTRSQPQASASPAPVTPSASSGEAPDFDLNFEEDDEADSFFLTDSLSSVPEPAAEETAALPAGVSSETSLPVSEVGPSNPAPVKQKVKIRSTMGKHTC